MNEEEFYRKVKDSIMAIDFLLYDSEIPAEKKAILIFHHATRILQHVDTYLQLKGWMART